QSVIEVMQQKELPKPQWIICDVGTSIFHREGGGDDQPYRPLQSYVNHLDQIVSSFSISQLVTQIKTHSRSEKGSDPLEASRLHDSLGLAGEGQIPFRIGSHDDLIFQEPEKQGRHKLSFYCKARTIDERVA